MRLAPLALALALPIAPLRSFADPIPVHVAAPRSGARGAGASNAERLAVADAVAQALGAVAREVLSATETRARIEGLNPSAVTCDALDCITAITLPLHARALVLVRETRQRDGARRVEVRLVNLRGEVIAERAEQDIATTTAEVAALARLAAAPIAEAIQRLDAPPPAAPVVAETPAPQAAPVTPRAAPTRPPQSRRLGETLAGAAAIAVGAGAFAGGVVLLAMGERVTRDLGENRVEVERPTSLNWVWAGLGAVSMGVGVFLLVDGMRLRPARASAALVPTPGGAMAVASGRF